MHNSNQSNQINAISRQLQVKIEKAVTGYGNQATQGPNRNKKTRRIVRDMQFLHLTNTCHHENCKPSHQGEKSDFESRLAI